MVASIECSLFRVGFVIPKPLSPKHRSTFLPLQHAATLILSVDWGLDYTEVRDLAEPKAPEAPLLTVRMAPDLKVNDRLLTGNLAVAGVCG